MKCWKFQQNPCIECRADQNMCSALLEFSMRNAMYRTWHPTFRLQYLFAIINKIPPRSLTSSIAHWVRHWTREHRVVQSVGLNPLGDVYWNCFSNYFILSFMLGQVDFSDIAILCNRPKNCCQQNLKCFDEPLFSSGLFSLKSSNNSTIWLVNYVLQSSAWLWPTMSKMCWNGFWHIL